MCIALLTTAHPDYALIVIDNRDEYVLRPTSRPHWWTHPESGHEILSSRDLQRPEKGTWLGITKTGELAVLTNYREPLSHDANHPISGVKSRGLIPTAWLGGIAKNGVTEGVNRLLTETGVKGVGGFSMVCTKLNKNSEGVAIVSNRASHMGDVPMVGQERGQVWGLSNTVFDDKAEWPKVASGKHRVAEAVKDAVSKHASQEDLITALFSVLDVDTMPAWPPGVEMEDYFFQLRHSIFIPGIGDEVHREEMEKAKSSGFSSSAPGAERSDLNGDVLVAQHLEEAATAGFMTGMYGTQRQTIVLVDWDGNVTFVERALWDENGHEIPRGEGDVHVHFKIDGWED